MTWVAARWNQARRHSAGKETKVATIICDLASLNKKSASFKSQATVPALQNQGYGQPKLEVQVPVATVHIDAEHWENQGRPNSITIQIGESA